MAQRSPSSSEISWRRIALLTLVAFALMVVLGAILALVKN